MAQMALRWCLDFEAVSVIIPGAKNPAQSRVNAQVALCAPLGAELHGQVAEFYEREVAAHIRGPY
jgi:aryl-alcohol dehydrogenase-like predicted oxidoreductase